MMTRQHIPVVALAACALLLAACSGTSSGAPSAPSTAACWQAMVTQYQHDVATGAGGTFPPACHGLPDGVLQSYALQILSGNTVSPTP